MKKMLSAQMLVALFLVGEVYTMEDNQVALRRPARDESQIALEIADMLREYGMNAAQNNEEFKTLVVQYFKKESVTIESNIMPHLDKRLRDSDPDIKKILEEDDRNKLKEFIHSLVTESLEDAFKEKDVKYDELKKLAEQRLLRSRYALITAIATGVLGAVTTFLGVYFGRA